MSIHSSLKSAGTLKRHRSVLGRLERVKLLQERGLLDPEQSSLLGLPKVRHLKVRIRKEKAATPAAGTAAAAGTAPAEAAAGASPAAAPAGKGAPKAPASTKASGPSAKPEPGGPGKKKE
ncbi:MAG: small basic protein [Candidatus Omnitrophica bacterium]|nr:small basic protein [Candidatus Omnitrophota bacterium]